MNRTFVRIVVVLALAFVGTQIVAQDLPAGDPRNELFRTHFQAVMNVNRNITDFETMRAGREYKLPDGKTDKLENGDIFGIWGHEFRKIYGIPYGDALAGRKPLDPLTGDTTLQPGITTVLMERGKIPGWIWFLVAFLLVLSLVLWIGNQIFARGIITQRYAERLHVVELENTERRQRNRIRELEYQAFLNVDPAAAGPPMFEGGVNNATASARFQEMAADRWRQLTGHEVASNMFTILGRFLVNSLDAIC